MPEHGQVRALQADHVWVSLVYGPDVDGFYLVEWPRGERERLHGELLDAGDLVAPGERSR